MSGGIGMLKEVYMGIMSHDDIVAKAAGIIKAHNIESVCIGSVCIPTDGIEFLKPDYETDVKLLIKYFKASVFIDNKCSIILLGSCMHIMECL